MKNDESTPEYRDLLDETDSLADRLSEADESPPVLLARAGLSGFRRALIAAGAAADLRRLRDAFAELVKVADTALGPDADHLLSARRGFLLQLPPGARAVAVVPLADDSREPPQPDDSDPGDEAS